MCITVRIVNLASASADKSAEVASGDKKVSKFVVIKSDSELLLVYGPLDEFSYHADIVKKYCDLNSIASGWIKKPDLYEIYGDSYHITGGGWLEENEAEKRLRVFGYSTAYGRFDDEDMMNLSEQAPELNGYEFSIED